MKKDAFHQIKIYSLKLGMAKAYKAAKNVLKNNLDLIISFGLAGSMTKKIRNSEVIIPNKILNEKFKFKKTSTISDNYLRKRSKEKIIKNVCLFTSDKILNKKIKLKLVLLIWRQVMFLRQHRSIKCHFLL